MLPEACFTIGDGIGQRSVSKIAQMSLAKQLSMIDRFPALGRLVFQNALALQALAGDGRRRDVVSVACYRLRGDRNVGRGLNNLRRCPSLK
ncbi:hypothetical protein [Mesorhizobium sp. Cs1299R1N3]|uniref:hypothetical protein n=1 Tax=Mesorhizobium sp. Cs1299R1N3 TaxID=3015173 RepID=UPI00301CACAE